MSNFIIVLSVLLKKWAVRFTGCAWPSQVPLTGVAVKIQKGVNQTKKEGERRFRLSESMNQDAVGQKSRELKVIWFNGS